MTRAVERRTERAGDAKQELRATGRQGAGGEARSFFVYRYVLILWKGK